MGRVEELLREGFRERLTLDRLAAEAGVHPAHVARVFRRVRGRSIADYRRELRVQAACSSLADPETTLADVAAATGFADQSHFTRVFKKVTGMTPAAFRSLVRAQTIHPLP
jgi:AraC family transcriptional regulator